MTRLPRSEQLTRQWKILQLLEGSRTGWTVEDLAAETEVSDKTIRRDLNTLSDVFPLTARQGPDRVKHWTMAPLSEQLAFTCTELLSVFMSQQFLEPLAGTPFWEGIQHVLRKVRNAVGPDGVKYMEKLSETLTATAVGAARYGDRGEWIHRLMTAIEDRRTTLIVYQSMQATEPVQQEIYPLGMVYHRGRLYLVAWSPRRQQVRTYRVDRIESVDVQNFRPQVPVDFSLEEWLAGTFGIYRSDNSDPVTVRVRFGRDVARYVQESRWHPSQKLQPQPDGSLLAEFRLCDTTEFRRWILSFGSAATVLEPRELMEHIYRDLQTLTDRYAPIIDRLQTEPHSQQRPSD